MKKSIASPTAAIIAETGKATCAARTHSGRVNGRSAKSKIAAMLCAVSGVAVAVPAAPAAAAIKVTFSGYFSDPTYSGNYPTKYDFQYSYFYRPQAIEHWCVDVYYAYCDRESVPLVAASGRIGETRIPFHGISGIAAAEYDDPVAFSLASFGDTHPYIAGAFVNYGWWLDRAPARFGRVGPENLQAFLPGGTVSGRAYLFNMTTTAVPEPASWLMLLAGFGAIGGALRRGRARRPMSVDYA